MSPDDPSAARPAGPVVLRIKLRYDDVETMILRFAPNVGKTGLFLPTKSLQPVGSEIKFELRLTNDQPVLVGLGRVKAAQPPDPDNPRATFGMAVELMRVTRESREVILKMLERRRSLGFSDVGIPMPADVDAARRADFVETGVKDSASGAIPAYMPQLESAPSTSFTAPRRQTGPIAVAKVVHVEPLAPEPPRKKRVPVAELIASASGPVVASIDGLDEEVDVASVLARARALAGGDLDGELEALRDSAATPVPIDIEGASAELARQLGGSAVRRDRSARWAPPPPTAPPEEKAEQVVALETKVEQDAAFETKVEQVAALETKVEQVAALVAERDVAERDVAEPTTTREAALDDAPAAAPADAPAAAEPADAKVEEPAEAKVEEPAEKDDALARVIGRFGAGSRERVAARRRDRMKRESSSHAAREHDEPSHVTRDDSSHVTRDDSSHVTRDDSSRVTRDDASRVARGEPPTEPARPAHEFVEPSNEHKTPVASIESVLPPLDDEPEDRHFQRRREPSSGLIHDDADASQFEEAHEVEPEQIHDEIHKLDEGDFEEVEHTQIGAVDEQIDADRLDAELAAAEADPEEDLGFGTESIARDPRYQPAAEQTVMGGELDPGASGGFSLGDEAAGDYVIPLGQQEQDEYDRGDSLEAALHAAVAQEAGGDEEVIEEIDDFEILAEADADDPDMMMTAPEERAPARPSGVGAPVELELPPVRPSFLNRLELDEDSGYHNPAPAYADERDDFAHSHGEIDPRVLSAGHALRAFEDPDEGQDFNAPGTFTPVPRDPYAPEPLGGGEDFDAPHGIYSTPSGFIPPDAFDQSDVISIRPEPQRDAENFDLETALEALDVDLDDLGDPRAGAPIVRRGQNRKPASGDDIPTARGRNQQPTEDARSANVRQTGGGRVVTPAPVPKSGRVHKRATTEDGIVIDFDDDDQ